MATGSDERSILAGLELFGGSNHWGNIGAGVMARGRVYAQRGQVASVALAESGTVLTAVVIGTAPRPYGVTVSMRRSGHTVRIDGRCTCPVGVNCKHVAAAILQAARPEMRRHLALLYPAGSGQERPGQERPGQERLGQERLDEVSAKPAAELSPGLRIWMNDLRLAQAGADDAYPEDVHQRLLYLLNPLAGANPQVADIGIEAVSVRLLKDGTWSAGVTAYQPQTLDDRGAGGTKFLRPADREILPRLARMAQRGSVGRAVKLGGSEGNSVLRAILATGRSYWGKVSGTAMRLDEPIDARIVWALNEDGSQSPTLALPEGCQTIRLAPPWCIDPAAATARPVRCDLADRVADILLAAPPVPVEQAEAVRARLEREVPLVVPHAPPVLAPPERLAEALVPVLRIEARSEPVPGYWAGRFQEATAIMVNVARPLFSYGGFEVAAHDPRVAPRFSRGGGIVEVVRDPPAELAALRTLDGIGFTPAGRMSHHGTRDAGLLALAPGEQAEAAWLEFLYHQAPRLREQGWTIVVADDAPTRLVRGEAAAFAAGLAPAAGGAGDGRIDWFELDLGVIVDGERIDLLPALIEVIASTGHDWSEDALDELDAGEPDAGEADAGETDAGEAGRPVFLRLPDGRMLALPRARLMPIARAIQDIMAARAPDEDGRLRLSTYDAALAAALEAAGDAAGMAWSGGETLRRLGRMLGETGSIPVAAIPEGFAAELRPYQARGVDWLQFMRAGGLAGILADEMGLGKTVQALAHILIEREAGRLTVPALIIAPTSLVSNWLREAERFAPALRVLVLHGPDRAVLFDRIVDHDLVISTYPLLGRDHAVLHAQRWHMVVLDEAQIIKNPNALTSRLMRGLQTEHRLCLTGTPLENNLGELWSLFAFLAPELLGDRKQFAKRWRTPIEKQGDTERQALLARYVRPFLLRRTKAAVAAELPPKTEIVETIGMEPAQRNLYEGIRLAMHGKVREAIAAKGLARSHIVILEALLRLRQTCCDPRLLKLPAARTAGVASAKLDRLAEMVPELVADGRRILIFSQFTSMLALIEPMLAEAKLDWVKLTGATRDRQAPIARFQAGEVPIFLISLKAGGVGLNLTAADTVIHYDPWWNPAVEDQATDRAHRIGQPNPVFVHRLVVADTVEEKMESLKRRKRQLAEGLFDSGAGDTLAFNEADIDDLFR